MTLVRSGRERGRPEAEEYQDPATGATILRLTRSEASDKHSYYDASPWSPDGRWIVFSSARPGDLTVEHRDNLATNRGWVCLLDTQTFSIRVLVENAFFTSHTGTYALWHPSGGRVYFYRRPNRVEAVDPDSGRTVLEYEGVLRQFSPDGSKICWSQKSGGVYQSGDDGSRPECLGTAAELYEITPNREEFRPDQMHVKNPKWSPDGRFILLANGIWNAPFVNHPARRSLYLVDTRTRSKQWLTYFGHHHSWAPDGRSIIFCGQSSDGQPRVFRYGLDTGEACPVSDTPAEGHPLLRPDGALLTTEDDQGILVIDPAARTTRRLAQYSQPFDKSHRGTHSHNVWSPDGRSVLYNSAETGNSQLYLAQVPDMIQSR